MEIIKSRYGLDRMVEKIGVNKIRITGESQFQRTYKNKRGSINMVDFEGGPFLLVGTKLSYQGVQWDILNITQLESGHDNLADYLLTVKMVW
jgi:hypothetical protein